MTYPPEKSITSISRPVNWGDKSDIDIQISSTTCLYDEAVFRVSGSFVF